VENEAIDLLIDNARFILTQDQSRTLLQGASIAVKGNRIAAIGDPQDLKTRYLPRRVINGSERLDRLGERALPP
jgi:hypothetical protein